MYGVERIFSTGRAVECDEAVSEGEGDEESVVRISVIEIELKIAVNALHVFRPPSPFHSSSYHRDDIFSHLKS